MKKLLYLLNKKLLIYILTNIYGVNLYKINLLFMISNISIFSSINKFKLQLSLYRLNIYLYTIFKLKSNFIIINKIKKFNIKV